MYSKRTVLWFLVISLFAVMIYGAVTTYVSSQAAAVIEKAGNMQGEGFKSAQSGACDRAQARFQELWDQSVESGSQASLERALDAAQNDVDRACS